MLFCFLRCMVRFVAFHAMQWKSWWKAQKCLDFITQRKFFWRSRRLLLLSREASTPFQSLRADMKLGKKCNGDFFRGDGTRLKSFSSYLNPPSRCWASTFLIKSILLHWCLAAVKSRNLESEKRPFPGFAFDEMRVTSGSATEKNLFSRGENWVRSPLYESGKLFVFGPRKKVFSFPAREPNSLWG